MADVCCTCCLSTVCCVGMKFPVDLLADVSHTELERLAHNYMNNLLYSNPDAPEHLTLPDSTQVNPPDWTSVCRSIRAITALMMMTMCFCLSSGHHQYLQCGLHPSVWIQ